MEAGRHANKQCRLAGMPRLKGQRKSMVSSLSPTSPFSAAQADLLALLLQQMLDNGGGSVPAIKFRSDHYEKKQILNSLESEGWIRRDQDQYHVRAVTLPLLETEAARQLMQSIEKLFAALLTQYRGTQTAPVKVDALATMSGESREVASAALRIMLDATLWWSGCQPTLKVLTLLSAPRRTSSTSLHSLSWPRRSAVGPKHCSQCVQPSRCLMCCVNRKVLCPQLR